MWTKWGNAGSMPMLSTSATNLWHGPPYTCGVASGRRIQNAAGLVVEVLIDLAGRKGCLGICCSHSFDVLICVLSD